MSVTITLSDGLNAACFLFLTLTWMELPARRTSDKWSAHRQKGESRVSALSWFPVEKKTQQGDKKCCEEILCVHSILCHQHVFVKDFRSTACIHSSMYPLPLSQSCSPPAGVAEADSRVIGDVLTQQLCPLAELAAAFHGEYNVSRL